MDLLRAFRLTREITVCLSLAGSGGKTTALFQLAQLLASPARGSADKPVTPTILVATTTHLAAGQLELANHHFMIRNLPDLEALSANLPTGIVAITGLPVEGDRVTGLGADLMEGLYSVARARRVSLLIEADGARLRPLKAPAGHEPVIPAFVEVAVLVAGLSGLGKPLGEEWVHRPEQFAALSGLEQGAPITIEALGRVLSHPDGGLKNIPPKARRVVLLNQADTADLQAQAQALAPRLLPPFESVVIAALKPGEGPASQIYAVFEPVAGVVLAAGGSVRLGQPKQVLLWQGEPLVRWAAMRAVQAGLSPVVVVVGAYAQEVSAALEGLPVSIVHNAEWESGQSSSLRAGLAALPPETGAAVFLLSDQPQVPVPLLRALVENHAASLTPIVAPMAGGRRANPVLFDRQTFADLAQLSGDVGGRALFSRYPVAWLEWQDERILLDVDTPQDYERLLGVE